jgi:hypothetical protein
MLFFHNIYGALLVYKFFACFLGVEKNYHPSQFHGTSLKIRIYHGREKYYQKNKSETNKSSIEMNSNLETYQSKKKRMQVSNRKLHPNTKYM